MEKYAVGLELDDWKVWAANQMLDAEVPTDPDAVAGWEVFSNNCTSCHVINGLTSLAAPEGETDTFAIYDGANRLIDKPVQVSGAAPNLTHIATRSSFAGGIFNLYNNVDEVPYSDLSVDGVLNRGALEAWLRNAPALKANYWDSPAGQRGMTPFPALSAEDIDHLVSFLMTLD
jgi:mono/diheme cytochrome c family protein